MFPFENDQLLKNRGKVFLHPEGLNDGVIDVDNALIQVPAVLFSFWQQFEVAVTYGQAKGEYLSAELPEELFDECLDALCAVSLISTGSGGL